MKKVLKWTGLILLALVLLSFGLFQYMKYNTKQHSPEMVVQYAENDLELSVFYNRPYKKGRTIFGGLVPYGEVWRTGANEPTTFTTNQDLRIHGASLPAGTYTLWTVPGKNRWKVIFNAKEYAWGINFDGKATREPAHDVLAVEVPVQHTDDTAEQFTIAFTEDLPVAMTLHWDDVLVRLPLER